jgi:endoglucanase Acf2
MNKIYAVHRKNGHHIHFNYKICSTKEIAEIHLKKIMDNYRKYVNVDDERYDNNYSWIEELELLNA